MSEKATFVGSSTLSKSLQEVAVETQDIPATEQAAPTEAEASLTSVNETGQLETNATVTENQEQPVQEAEENVGSFDIGFGEEEKQQDGSPAQVQPNNDWRTALKNVDRNELLKELGIEEFAVKINEHIKKGGKASDFIAAKGVNWDEVPDLDLVRADFDAKHSFLTKEEKNARFNKKYVATEFDDDDVAMDKNIELKTAAYEARQRRIAEAQNFKEPEVIQPEQDAEYTNWKQTQTQLNTNREQIKTFLVNHEATKNLLQNKRVAIQVDDKGTQYNFGIDKPEAVINGLMDGGKTWNKLITNAQGEPDVPKQHLIMLFASNPQKFVGQIFNYGKMQGAKQKVMENNNAIPQIGTQPRNAVTQTEKEAWKNATSGKLGLVG